MAATQQSSLETVQEAPQHLEAHSAMDWDVWHRWFKNLMTLLWPGKHFIPQSNLGMLSKGHCKMPVCPTGYTLASFRPCPISNSSLGTAKMPKLSKKAKLKKKKGIFKPSGFLLTSTLECSGSFPSKFANRNQQEGKPHAWIKCWALCK